MSQSGLRIYPKLQHVLNHICGDLVITTCTKRPANRDRPIIARLSAFDSKTPDQTLSMSTAHGDQRVRGDKTRIQVSLYVRRTR